jgi:prevent-host-death family protein
VERGESIIITRHGKPVARITPEAQIDQKRVEEAMQAIRELRKRVGKMSIEEILAARDEGRA